MPFDRRFPRGTLIAAAALVAFAMAAATAASVGGIGVTRIAESEPASIRNLLFQDLPGGGVAVIDAANNETITVLAPGNDGFVRIVLRGLVRERLRQANDRQTPFRLTRWADGRLSVEDPTTGRSVDLGAFGAVNAASFSRLMTVEETTR
jgi:putative photosynthetic complex assembly protein